jgi:predicted nucleotidyltransferase
MGSKEIDDSLGAALFSGVQQRVLGALFSNPDRSFYGNELLRLTKSGKGALQRVLARLQRVGLINMQVIGKQKHYQANKAAPIFEELHGIVIKTFGLADVLRNALLPHSSDIEVAFVYGSVAKRKDRSHSDIDLFVVSENLSYQDVMKALESAESRLGRKINPTLHSRAELARKRAEGNSFVTRVLEQAKIFIIGAEHDLAKP